MLLRIQAVDDTPAGESDMEAESLLAAQTVPCGDGALPSASLGRGMASLLSPVGATGVEQGGRGAGFLLGCG